MGLETDEQTDRVSRLIRLPAIFLCLVLLASVAFAAKDINATPAQIKEGKLYQNLSLIDGSGFTDEKLNDKTYRVYSNQSKSEVVFDFSIKNKISASNTLLDCDILTCDMVIGITPQGKNIKFDNSIVSGSWAFGNASVVKVFFYQNVTTTTTTPTYGTHEVSDGNSTLNETYQNGTQSVTTTQTIEQTDLKQLYADDGQERNVVVRFGKTNAQEDVDIRPKMMGKEYTDWAWWNSTWTAKYPITFYYNQSIPTAQNYVIGFVSINTSNTTLFNQTTGTNVRFLDSTESVLLNYKLMSNNTTTFLGASIYNTTYAVVLNMSALLNNTTAYMYVGNVAAASGESLRGNIIGGFCNQANLSVFWPFGEGSGTTTTEVCNGTTGTLTGNAQFNSTALRGFGLFGAAGNTDDGMTFGAVGTGSTYTLLAYAGMVVADANYRTLWWGNSGYYFTASGAAPLGELSTFNPKSSSGYIEPANLARHQLGLSCSAGSGQFYINGTAVGSAVTCRTEGLTKYMTAGGGQTWDTLTSEPMVFNVSFSADRTKAFYSLNSIVGTLNTSAPSTSNITSATTTTPANGAIYPASTTSIGFVFTCNGADASYLTNITIGGVLNTSAIPTTNNTPTTQAVSFGANGVYTYYITCYNGSDALNSASSTFYIINQAPNITQFSLTPNGSAYQLGPLAFNITYVDWENSTATLYYSVFKNGSNQTTLAGAKNLVNNTLTNVYLDYAGPFNPTDYWNVSVFVSDGGNQSVAVMSNNTTIGNYFTNITSITAAAYSDINFRSYLNMTLAGAATASAVFNIGGVNTSAVSTAGPPVYLFSSNQPAPHVTALTNYAGTWYLTATLSNGSTFTSYNATGVVVPVNISGLFLCNSTLTPSIYYNIIDAITLLPINATLSTTYTWIGDNGNSLSNTFTTTNNTTSVCITPASFNQATTASEITTATGYLSSVVSAPSYNYSSTTITRTISLINSTFGGYYTFQVINQYNAPVPNALVIISKTGTIVLNSTTDINGYVFSPLQQLTSYQITASATGYTTETFPFTAGAITTNTIMLQAVVPSVNATSPYSFINNVFYSIGPSYRSFLIPTNLTLNISSANNSLASWGWKITRNGTLVDTQNSASNTGGLIYYTANQIGKYEVKIWFIQQGLGNFTPAGTLYFYYNDTGVMAAADALQGGSVISPFTYYLIALICALMAAAYASQYVGSGAAVVGLIVLAGFTFMWPDGVVVNIGFADLTTTSITIITAVITFAVFYLSQFGV